MVDPTCYILVSHNPDTQRQLRNLAELNGIGSIKLVSDPSALTEMREFDLSTTVVIFDHDSYIQEMGSIRLAQLIYEMIQIRKLRQVRVISYHIDRLLTCYLVLSLKNRTELSMIDLKDGFTTVYN